METAESYGKGHGRREHRKLQCSTRLAGWLDWPGVAQVCRLERTTWRRGKLTTEVAYAITSAPRKLARATDLLVWWRGHWHIENHLHWVRDVALGEDGCRIRTGAAPSGMAALRNAALNLLRSSGLTEITRTLRENAYRVDRLFTRLGILKN